MVTEFRLDYTASDINKKLGKIDTLAEKNELPTKVSDLTNDVGFISEYTETDPTVPTWAKEPTKPSYTADEVGALPADTVIPVVPDNVSAFTNDAGYLTEHQSLAGLATEGYVDNAISEKIDKFTMPDLGALIYESIYGVIDGNIETLSNNKLTYIRDYAFYKHQNLRTVDFANATSIGDYSFYKCSALSVANTPSVTNIGRFAFKNCEALTSVEYPLATTVEQGAFDECSSLSSVNLPLLTSVEPLTFRKCNAFTTLDLQVATNIGTQAFYNSGITSLTLRSNTVVALENEDAFYFTPIEEGSGYIYVPSNLVDSYKNSAVWSTYANQIKAIL